MKVCLQTCCRCRQHPASSKHSMNPNQVLHSPSDVIFWITAVAEILSQRQSLRGAFMRHRPGCSHDAKAALAVSLNQWHTAEVNCLFCRHRLERDGTAELISSCLLPVVLTAPSTQPTDVGQLLPGRHVDTLIFTFTVSNPL